MANTICQGMAVEGQLRGTMGPKGLFDTCSDMASSSLEGLFPNFPKCSVSCFPGVAGINMAASCFPGGATEGFAKCNTFLNNFCSEDPVTVYNVVRAEYCPKFCGARYTPGCFGAEYSSEGAKESPIAAICYGLKHAANVFRSTLCSPHTLVTRRWRKKKSLKK